jgi:prevent-host-death family protein
MEAIPISKFKATCLAALDRVRKTGQPLLVTKRGVPIAQVMPPPKLEPSEPSAFGSMSDGVEELGDVVAPLPPEDWEAIR